MNQNRQTQSLPPKFRFRSLVTWLLCLLAAFCLWLYVMAVESPEYEQTFHVTVELTGREELQQKRLAVYSGGGSVVDVTLMGRRSVISRLKDEDIVATADLSGITEAGRQPCSIVVDALENCKISSVTPDYLSVYVDESVTVYMDLTEQRENTSLPEGCFVGPLEMSSDKIAVTGPRSYVNSVKAVCVRLDMSGVQKTTVMTENVLLLNSRGDEIDKPYLECEPSYVSVRVPILKSVETEVPVSFRWGFLNEENASVSVEPMTVTATGEPDVIDRGGLVEPIVVDERTEVIDLAVEKTAALKAPEGVTLSAAQASVSVTLDPDLKTRRITVSGYNIQDTGGRDDVYPDWDKDPVSVIFLGPEDILSKLTPEDVSLVLDMSPYNSSNIGSTSQVRAEVRVDSPYRNDVLPLGYYDITVTFKESP